MGRSNPAGHAPLTSSNWLPGKSQEGQEIGGMGEVPRGKPFLQPENLLRSKHTHVLGLKGIQTEKES